MSIWRLSWRVETLSRPKPHRRRTKFARKMAVRGLNNLLRGGTRFGGPRSKLPPSRTSFIEWRKSYIEELHRMDERTFHGMEKKFDRFVDNLLEEKLENLDGRIESKLEEKVENLDGRIQSKLEEKLENLDGLIQSKLEERLENLDGRVQSKLKEKVDRLVENQNQLIESKLEELLKKL